MGPKSKLKTETTSENSPKKKASRSLRLEKLRQYQADRIIAESPEQRAERLLALKQYQRNRIRQELPVEREERLQKLRDAQKRRLENETPEQREIRLATLRANYYKRRGKTSKRKKKKIASKTDNLAESEDIAETNRKPKPGLKIKILNLTKRGKEIVE